MTAQTPYISVSPRQFASVDTWDGGSRSVAQRQLVEGYHAIWAARIPYIPLTMLSDQDAQSFGLDATQRIRWFLDRQVRLLHDLSQIDTSDATFELRYIADPRPGAEARVTIALLGKVFAQTEDQARLLAQAQWERVQAIFPSEAPYHYPLAPVEENSAAPGVPAWQDESFAHVFEPIPEALLNQNAFHIVELRKYEDWPTHRATGAAALDVDYIPHPFTPPIDYMSMARLLETLARQANTACVSVVLRPQRLAPREQMELARFAGWYDQVASGQLTVTNAVIETQRQLGMTDFAAYYQQRGALGKQVYSALLNQQSALFLLNVRVVAQANALPALIEALGTELITNNDARYPSRYETRTPNPQQPDELQWARYNFRWLEMERWGVSPLFQRRPELARFRYLVSAPEAVAAFRLPTATPGAQLHGIDILDDPFDSPSNDAQAPDDVVGLGRIVRGGIAQPIGYRLSRAALAQGVALFGEDDATAAQTTRAFVAYALDRRLPTIILGPSGGKSIQAALVMVREELAPAEPPAQFTQDPLAPPPGMPLMQWADALARALALAFELPGSVCPLMQIALFDAYVAAGANPTQPWPEGGVAPTLAEVAQTLPQALAANGATEETQRRLREQLLPGLREMATVPGPLVMPGVEARFTPIIALSQPSGMFRSDTAHFAAMAVRALLTLARYAQAGQASARPPLATLLLMEAHRLFPAQRGDDQPLLPLLDALRQAGGSALLWSARPQQLAQQALGASVIATQRQVAPDALARCQQLMRLTDREASHLNKLAVSETLWRRDGALTLARHATAAPGAVDALPGGADWADGALMGATTSPALRQIGGGGAPPGGAQ